MDILDSKAISSFIMLIITGIGILSCFFGYKLFKIYIAIVGFTLAFVISFLATKGDQILFSLFIGIVVGIVSFYVYSVGVFIVGALFGFLIMIFFGSLSSFELNGPFTVLCMVISGILAIKFQKIYIIISTAFSGASTIVFGISGMISSESIYELIFYSGFIGRESNSNVKSLIQLCLAIAGIYYQYQTTNKLTEQETASNDSEEIVKIRCASCQSLCDEISEYCNKCGTQL